MDNLNSISAIVKYVMEQNPETRSSDDLLYFKVCESVNPTYTNYPFCQIMQNIRRYGVPSYKSVERARRKLQREFPELSADDKVEGFRVVNEGEYKAYARKGAM